jgi:hypothetical protein
MSFNWNIMERSYISIVALSSVETSTYNYDHCIDEYVRRRKSKMGYFWQTIKF